MHNRPSFSLDPTTGEVFGPVANPSPDYTPNMRPGMNLYTNSVISLDAETGKLNWHYQAVPHDEHDWDLGTPPTLYRGRNGTDMLAIAGKNGRVLGINRASKAVVFNTPATTIANDGPIEATPTLVCPGTIGGAQWNGTAYHPGLGIIYPGMVDWCWHYHKHHAGDDPTAPLIGSPIWNFAVQPRGWITAMDGESGRVLWQYHADAQVIAGLVPTKSGVLFGGDVRGNLLALDAANGTVLKRIDAKGALNNGLISYAVDGSQYVAAAVGGLSLNSAGVSGKLRVSVFGLSGDQAPKVVTLDRTTPTMAGLDKGAALYISVCVPCHGPRGESDVYPALIRHTQLADPEALKAFLASVPPPMPRLYPGLLEDNDIRLIAGYLKTITRPATSLPPSPALPTAAPPAQASPSEQHGSR